MHENKSAPKAQDFKNNGVLKFLSILALLVFLISVLWPDKNLKSKIIENSVQKAKKKDMLICKEAINILVSEDQPVRNQNIHEHCLSGIIRLPLNQRFIVDAPGWSEYWFITPNGYKIYRVGDSEANFPKATLASSTFRIRGKAGIAKIQLELN